MFYSFKLEILLLSKSDFIKKSIFSILSTKKKKSIKLSNLEVLKNNKSICYEH